MPGSNATVQELYDRYSKGLRRSVDRVYADGSDADLADRFRANVSRFAAYKADYVRTTVNNILNDASIPLKQRQEMADAAVAGFDRYSEAECNTATSRCRTAKQWKEFNDPQRLRLFPNLRWLPSRSTVIRATHEKFYDKVWPKGDDFWNTNMPGQEWNCKCDLEETDDPATDNSDVKTVPVPKGLEGNPSVTGEIFTDRASYISKARKDAETDIIKAIRDYNRNIYGASNMVLKTSIGQVQIDNITIEEVTKGASNTESYFMKQEIVQNFSEYTNKLKKTGSETIDLSHNNPKSKFAKRKRKFESMEVFLLETKWKDFDGNIKIISYSVKLGKYKDTGIYHLYSITD